MAVAELLLLLLLMGFQFQDEDLVAVVEILLLIVLMNFHFQNEEAVATMAQMRARRRCVHRTAHHRRPDCKLITPRGGRGCLMSSSCLES